ncbi:TetR family transcriptional regulator [Gordonia sp. FQ]|uniref:TetR/AcrR family transcriptional regulator n=1 Tax=Gordonia sp. FQ TaxID=3446634 RepID=UPI003F8483FD
MTSGGTRQGHEQLLLAGERLIAERGPDVALRDIALAAGQRNNSAVHYHFGSRDGLIVGIVERRQAGLDQQRMAMLADIATGETEPVGLPALVRVLVEPMFTVPYAQGSTHYARFLDRVRTHPEVLTAQRLDRWPATDKLARLLHAEMRDLPPDERVHRLTGTTSALFALLADYEATHAGDPAAMDPDRQRSIIAMTTGMLGYRADE